MNIIAVLKTPGVSVVKNPPANAGDTGSIPELGKSPGEGNGNVLQCFCLGHPMERGAQWATVHGVSKELDMVQQSVLFSSVVQSCLTPCNPMNCSTPGHPVHHQLPESTQTHVHRVGDAIQTSHPLLSSSPPALNLAQHQGLFQ